MARHPLTHHEILGLIEPFTRRGLHVDLAASNRIERRLLFKPIVHEEVLHEDEGAEFAGASEVLQLESPERPDVSAGARGDARGRRDRETDGGGVVPRKTVGPHRSRAVAAPVRLRGRHSRCARLPAGAGLRRGGRADAVDAGLGAGPARRPHPRSEGGHRPGLSGRDRAERASQAMRWRCRTMCWRRWAGTGGCCARAAPAGAAACARPNASRSAAAASSPRWRRRWRISRVRWRSRRASSMTGWRGRAGAWCSGA